MKVPKSCDGSYCVAHKALVTYNFRLSQDYSRPGSKGLYVSFYMFSATWGISKLHPAPGQPALLLVPGKAEYFRLEMSVPPPRNIEDQADVEDTIRVCVCDASRSWEDITLSDLPAEAFRGPLKTESVVLEATCAKSGSTGAITSRKVILYDCDQRGEEELEEKWEFVDVILHTASALIIQQENDIDIKDTVG
ncbi:hypothetical protein TWF788_009507 [Orbilia oligospora]|uniref:Uncharacterized protein n=1 Tax=Orbilia oligospora TaxID=2813651 RepID=A0A7C8KRC5_ORBOL|nr:hypothetical protein TWF788_009507 [Orbilia oligospora]